MLGHDFAQPLRDQFCEGPDRRAILRRRGAWRFTDEFAQPDRRSRARIRPHRTECRSSAKPHWFRSTSVPRSPGAEQDARRSPFAAVPCRLGDAHPPGIDGQQVAVGRRRQPGRPKEPGVVRGLPRGPDAGTPGSAPTLSMACCACHGGFQMMSRARSGKSAAPGDHRRGCRRAATEWLARISAAPVGSGATATHCTEREGGWWLPHQKS